MGEGFGKTNPKKYQYFFAVCVKSCPQKGKTSSCFVTPPSGRVFIAKQHTTCPKSMYDTNRVMFNNICVPGKGDKINEDYFEKVMSDLAVQGAGGETRENFLEVFADLRNSLAIL